MKRDTYRSKLRLCALLVVLGTLFSATISAAAPQLPNQRQTLPNSAQQTPVARLIVFHSDSCPSCVEVLEEVIDPLYVKYGKQVEIKLLEITDPTNMQLLIALEQAYGVPPERATIPEVFIGTDVFLGDEAIRRDLDNTIASYLAQGGVDYTPPMKELFNIQAAQEARAGAVVHGVMFHMTTCGHCEMVIENVLPLLRQRYGDQFELKLINVDSDEDYAAFLRFVRSLPDAPEQLGVPTIVIGDQVMVGSNQIPERIEAIINTYLDQGGIDYPAALPASLNGSVYSLDLAHQRATEAAPTATITGPTAAPGTPAIHLAYFHQAGCQDCDRVSINLENLGNTYPQLVVSRFDVKEYAPLSEWMGMRANVPEEKRLTAPAIFVGEAALIGDDITLSSLETLIQQHLVSGAEPVWESYESEQAESTIVERFNSLGILTVAGAGLVDGLNPCAFATLVFFVSYLSISGRKGRELLAVGAAFALGVFITYLAVGLGLWKVLGAFDFLARIGRWVYILTAILCVALAVLSFGDFLKARQGKTDDMTLALPHAWRMRINSIIRRGRHAKAYVPIAFITGLAVSLIELACTGQVYLPTIIFVLSVPEMQTKAFGYLLLYNLFFIIPLIVVFVLAYYGTTAKQLTKFLQNNAAPIKLSMTVLFVLLATWLFYALL